MNARQIERQTTIGPMRETVFADGTRRIERLIAGHWFLVAA